MAEILFTIYVLGVVISFLMFELLAVGTIVIHIVYSTWMWVNDDDVDEIHPIPHRVTILALNHPYIDSGDVCIAVLLIAVLGCCAPLGWPVAILVAAWMGGAFLLRQHIRKKTGYDHVRDLPYNY